MVIEGQVPLIQLLMPSHERSVGSAVAIDYNHLVIEIRVLLTHTYTSGDAWYKCLAFTEIDNFGTGTGNCFTCNWYH